MQERPNDSKYKAGSTLPTEGVTYRLAQLQLSLKSKMFRATVVLAVLACVSAFVPTVTRASARSR